MMQLSYLFAVLMLSLAISAVSNAEVLILSEAPYSAVGDGIANDRPALGRAFAAAKPGDIVFVPPGRYRIVLTGGPLGVPEGVTLLGQIGLSTLLLDTDGKPTDHREFLRASSGVTLEGLTIERNGNFPGIVFPINGDATDIAFRSCRIVGNRPRFSSTCHAFRVGHGTVKNFTLDGVTVEEFAYGLFQTNNAKGTLEDVTVVNCRFERNASSDLEFNSPQGVMRRIVVRDCFFRDNQSKQPSGGFAVGFANVFDGRVENCVIQNYGSEALHVEDRSEEIHLVGNTIVAGSTIQNNGVILIVNDSRRVTIANNVIDARANTNRAHLILVTAGGAKFKNPSEVVVKGNVLIHGPETRTWYLQPGSSAEPEANLVIPAAKESE